MAKLVDALGLGSSVREGVEVRLLLCAPLVVASQAPPQAPPPWQLASNGDRRTNRVVKSCLADVAQLVEHLSSKQVVAGSNPVVRSTRHR